jgi:hypothetical protein
VALEPVIDGRAAEPGEDAGEAGSAWHRPILGRRDRKSAGISLLLQRPPT